MVYDKSTAGRCSCVDRLGQQAQLPISKSGRRPSIPELIARPCGCSTGETADVKTQNYRGAWNKHKKQFKPGVLLAGRETRIRQSTPDMLECQNSPWLAAKLPMDDAHGRWRTRYRDRAREGERERERLFLAKGLAIAIRPSM